MPQFSENIKDAAEYIKSRCSLTPQVGIILGSGLGAFAEQIQVEARIPFQEIPHFSTTTVTGHQGHLVLGSLAELPLAIFQGRVHYYEGHSMQAVTFGTRVLATLGINTLIVTNAAGGLNPSMKPGDLMIIEDHINLMGDNPLRGANLENLGPRFPDMSEAYNRELIASIQQIMEEKQIDYHRGVYCAVQGPSYETPAEVRYLQQIGAQAVGMSTVPEVIAANHMGLKVGGISCITNLAAGLSPTKLSHQEVTDTAKEAEGRFRNVLEELIRSLDPRKN